MFRHQKIARAALLLPLSASLVFFSGGLLRGEDLPTKPLKVIPPSSSAAADPFSGREKDKGENMDSRQRHSGMTGRENMDPPRRMTRKGKPILVGLRVNVEQVTLHSSEKIGYETLVKRGKGQLNKGDIRLSAKGGVVLADGKPLDKKVRFESETDGVFLELNDKGFRGRIIARAGDNKLTLINELDVDDYLKGVLPREVGVQWPLESLRAQAVASRTYLASHLNKHSSEGFDLCSDVHCQVYGGMAKEHPATNQAVDDTYEEILVYQGKPIAAYFHSNCGGSTEQVGFVWGLKNEDYLPRRKCGFGPGDPRYNWTTTLHDDQILSALRKSTKVRGDRLRAVYIKKKSPSGRAQTVTVTTDEGAFDLSGNEFRIALNPEVIRSTLWLRLSRKSGAYVFKGRGWGHGVGMCQWGAKGQGAKGRGYVEILKFYYPHARLQLWHRK